MPHSANRRRARSPALALSLAAMACLTALPVSVTAATIITGAAGDAFYSAPQPLAEGPVGSVIAMRAAEGTMALPSAARNHLLMYRSKGAKDKMVAVTGTVSIPKGTAPKGGWPVITWTHGTTGLAPECAPSRDNAQGLEHPYIETIAKLLDGFVARGYAVVATDYEGLGLAGDHPFLQGRPTARNALDMIRAARNIEPDIGKRYMVVGHSQGGQVDLFAASIGPRYAPELTLLGNVAFAPGSHIADRLKSVISSTKAELTLAYLTYTLKSYAQTNPRIDLGKILSPEAIRNMPALMDGCMSKALESGYWSTAIGKDQFVEKPDLAEFLKMARRNEPGLLKIPVPTLVVQGSKDVTVPPGTTDATVRDLCKGGNPVRYATIADADHNGSMVKGAATAQAFIDARFKGARFAGNCKKLPKAAQAKS